MTTTRDLNLEIWPVDTLMFRDGRPFNQGDPGATEAVSVFPPHPNTVSGMVRALLARKSGRRQALSFSAPVVCRERNSLFPAPRSLLRREDGRYIRLVPGPAGACDLGDGVRLPEPDIAKEEKAGLKDIEDGWITLAGLQKILNGKVPFENDLVPRDQLWRREPRVGIGIDMAERSQLEQRRPIDGALYAAAHSRLAESVSLRVTVSTTDGTDIKLGLPALSAAGGEHRMAQFVASDPPQLPSAAGLKSYGSAVRFTIYHAAPCFLWPLPKPNKPFGRTPSTGDTSCLAAATVVSACLGKAQMIGGWDTAAKGPVPMRPAIPAGSAWFLEALRIHEAGILALHGKHMGESLGRGFGQIFIGTW